MKDHVARYLEECCVIDFSMKEYETKTETLYNHYVRWCTERDRIIPLSENVFGSKLVEHGIQKKRKRVKGEGQQYFYVPVVLTHVLRGEKGQGDILSTLEEKSAAYEMAVSDK
ncbi:MAG TPA: primase-like DNA-binding domain-containing protein [Nitrososphaera sp.]|nr:primase-like DNA-binding domain-containing protein [Nitrososphaera sp.]